MTYFAVGFIVYVLLVVPVAAAVGRMLADAVDDDSETDS